MIGLLVVADSSGGIQTVGDVDVAMLLRALTDAIDYRNNGGDECGDCADDDLCEDHAGDEALADSYSTLFDQITEATR